MSVSVLVAELAISAGAAADSRNLTTDPRRGLLTAMPTDVVGMNEGSACETNTNYSLVIVEGK